MHMKKGRELVLDALSHKELARAPWVPYTGVQIANLRGYDAEELLKDSSKLVECLLEAHRQYSPDGMPVVFDLQIEAEILGCPLVWSKDTPPSVAGHPLESAERQAIADLKIPTAADGRIPLVLDAMRRTRAALPETALYGLACGPFTLASHLRGTNIFLDMYDNPELVQDLIAFSVKVFKAMATMFIEAGMDVIGSVDPLVSQIAPATFEEFLLAPYTELFSFLREKGAKSSFFVCGDATKNIPLMCESGPDCLSIDENIDIVAAKRITDAAGIAISGNMQLTVTMLLGSQKDNQKAALDLLDAMGTRDFILAPGCDIPFHVPAENIIGIGQAVHHPKGTRKFLVGYERAAFDQNVEMPDYESYGAGSCLVEVYTIDSATCAACGYMKAAADEAAHGFGGRVEVIERKILDPENIVRVGKLGLTNLPTIVVNGVAKFVSIIPNRNELASSFKEGLAS